jgi:hypothetical protein
LLVPVISPNDPELGLLELGLLKLGWFNTLKASMRISTVIFSLIGKRRDNWASELKSMGP